MRFAALVVLAGCGRISFDPVGGSNAGEAGDGSVMVSLTSRLGLGAFHACLLSDTGKLACWGENLNGQLGLGAADVGIDHPTPTAMTAVHTWIDIALGWRHTCALEADHQAWCWGLDDHGQLGLDATVPGTDRADPQLLPDGRTYQRIFAGSYHTCGIATDGTLWCWGRNGAQQLGIGNSTDQGLPQQVVIVAPQPTGTDDQWAQIGTSDDHTCAVQTDGRLWCWGSNGNGQLGQRGSGSIVRNRPELVLNAAPSYQSVHGGIDYECALVTGGQVQCLGRDDVHQLGDNATANQDAPVVLDSATYTALDAGIAHACAIRTDGTLWCWGAGGSGQIGAAGVGASQPVPIQVAGTWHAIATGNDFSCGIDTSATVWCWGRGTHGETGAGDSKNGDIPVRVAF